MRQLLFAEKYGRRKQANRRKGFPLTILFMLFLTLLWFPLSDKIQLRLLLIWITFLNLFYIPTSFPSFHFFCAFPSHFPSITSPSTPSPFPFRKGYTFNGLAQCMTSSWGMTKFLPLHQGVTNNPTGK